MLAWWATRDALGYSQSMLYTFKVLDDAGLRPSNSLGCEKLLSPRLLESAHRLTEAVGKLLRDPKAYQQFQAALTNLQETTRRINAGEGSLGIIDRLILADEAAQTRR